MIRWTILTLLAFTALTTAAARPPNIVLIVCDNLGYGDVEPFGSTLHRTPNLNRMAREGRRFTHFYVSAGVCTPSRASIMTGCYAQRVGMHVNPHDGLVLRPVSPHGLHPDEVTVAEVLKERGYATAIIGKWHLGDQPEFLPTRQGFDSYYGIPYSDDMVQAMGQRMGKRMNGNQWPPLPLMENEEVVEAPTDRNLLTKKYTERALAFISANRDRPFFLYLPQAMPGSTRTPYASPAFKDKSRNGAWGDSVEELDGSTGQILDHLVQEMLDQNTLVIWTSDNGAPLDRDPKKPTRGSNGMLYGRGYTTAEGAFRVPTIMWWPGRIPTNTTCGELASTMDFLPTFAALAGTDVPTARVIDGHDVRPLIFGKPKAKTPYEVFYYYQQDQLQAVRHGPWKLFLPLANPLRHPRTKQVKAGKPLLFHLHNDPKTTENVAATYPEIVKKLQTYAEQARIELGDHGRPGRAQRPIGKVSDPTPRLTQTDNAK